MSNAGNSAGGPLGGASGPQSPMPPKALSPASTPASADAKALADKSAGKPASETDKTDKAGKPSAGADKSQVTSEAPAPKKKSKWDIVLFESLKIQDRINFSRHLSIVIKAGLPVYEGLKIIRKQTTSKSLLRIIDDLITDVNNGKFLADSLAKHRRVFGDFFVSIIRVGESSGTLSKNLIYLAEEMEKARDLKGKIKAALIYPIILLVVTLSIVSFLVIFVFPKLISVFASLSIELPATTRIMIFVSQFLLAYGHFVVIGLILFAIFIRLLFKHAEWFHAAVNWVMLYTPVLGSTTTAINSANFSRVLGLLLKSGITIVEGVTITSQTFDNVLYKRAIARATDAIQKGETMASYLEQHKNLFSPLLIGLIEIGETTGNLEENLEYIAQFYATEVEIKIRNLTAVMEPMLLLFMGALVGFVAVSIITPIYKITNIAN